jgi:hypothetical protein
VVVNGSVDSSQRRALVATICTSALLFFDQTAVLVALPADRALFRCLLALVVPGQPAGGVAAFVAAVLVWHYLPRQLHRGAPTHLDTHA